MNPAPLNSEFAAPGEDGTSQPGKHAVSWMLGGFASIVIPGFVAMWAGLL